MTHAKVRYFAAESVKPDRNRGCLRIVCAHTLILKVNCSPARVLRSARWDDHGAGRACVARLEGWECRGGENQAERGDEGDEVHDFGFDVDCV